MCLSRWDLIFTIVPAFCARAVNRLAVEGAMCRAAGDVADGHEFVGGIAPQGVEHPQRRHLDSSEDRVVRAKRTGRGALHDEECQVDFAVRIAHVLASHALRCSSAQSQKVVGAWPVTVLMSPVTPAAWPSRAMV